MAGNRLADKISKIVSAILPKIRGMHPETGPTPCHQFRANRQLRRVNFLRNDSVRYLHVLLLCFTALLTGCAQFSGKFPSGLWQSAPPLAPWELQMFPIETNWAAYDEEIPVVLAGLPEVVPGSHTLPKVLAPGDQGSQSSGVAWAAGYSAFSYLQRQKGSDPEYICAPAAIFNRLNRGRNQAISILSALRYLQHHGCPHEKYMPYREADYVYQPGALAREDAENYRARGFGRVDFQDSEQIKAHLLQGSVVIVRMRISENFVKHQGPVWRVPAGREVGSQALALIGYDDARSVYIVQNSAGGEWGTYGRTGIPYEWFMRLAEKAYVVW